MSLIGRAPEVPDPKVYLSFSGGKYRVIDQGMPLGRDELDAADALATAARFKLKVSDRMWDGDAGQWVARPAAPAPRFDVGLYELFERRNRLARARCKRLKHHLDPNHVEQWDHNHKPAGFCIESMQAVEKRERGRR